VTGTSIRRPTILYRFLRCDIPKKDNMRREKQEEKNPRVGNAREKCMPIVKRLAILFLERAPIRHSIFRFETRQS
jgi:hypothetical protein